MFTGWDLLKRFGCISGNRPSAEKNPLKRKASQTAPFIGAHKNERGKKKRQIRNGLDDSTVFGCFPVQRNERKVCFLACCAMLLLLAVVAVVYVWAFGVVCRPFSFRLVTPI